MKNEIMRQTIVPFMLVIIKNIHLGNVLLYSVDTHLCIFEQHQVSAKLKEDGPKK